MQQQRNHNPKDSMQFPYLGSLGWNIVCAMILVSLVPLFVLAYQGYHCARQAILERTEEHLMSMVEFCKKDLERHLRQRGSQAGGSSESLLENLVESYNQVHPDAHVALFSRPKGRHVIAPYGKTNEQKVSYLSAALQTPHSTGLYRFQDSSGQVRLAVWAPVPGTKWSIGIDVRADEALLWLGELRRRALLTMAVTLLVVLLLSVWLAGRVVRPMRELVAVADRIRSGRFAERLGPVRGSEAERLREAINRMLDELERYRHKLALSASLASIGELSSRIVHELRNPLSSIKVNLQALAEKVTGDPLYRELARIAQNQVERLEKMLNELLDYGKPVQPSPREISFTDLLLEVRSVVSAEIQRKNVELIVREESRETLWCDPSLLSQALANILMNAVQAVGEGGKAWISYRAEDELRILEVADNGPGLVNVDKSELFKPFYSARPGGTGLGLANAKKIVELHGGTVHAGERPGGGAVFTMSLPGAPASSTDKSSIPG